MALAVEGPVCQVLAEQQQQERRQVSSRSRSHHSRTIGEPIERAHSRSIDHAAWLLMIASIWLIRVSTFLPSSDQFVHVSV